MGLMDKIKNALFEVEYVEVEEPVEKEKKSKKGTEEKPIAKKVILPGKKEEKIEELEEEELRDEDFEIRPKDEPVREKPKEEFKLMDEDDFRMDDEDEFGKSKFPQELEHEEQRKEPYSTRSERLEPYSTPISTPQQAPKQNKLYGIDNSYEIEMHPYGKESKEEKTFFKPSPILSPIYGILDKNYKKEDVRDKKDTGMSSYGSAYVTVDEVRNKAYGEKKEEKVEEKPTKFEVTEEENLLVDLSDRSKPEVKELTMGDAIEYFQDLGLEYNVDYVDVSKEKGKTAKEATRVEEHTKKVEELLTSKEEEKPSKKEEPTPADNDNLFDLIDSMYEEKD